jgi:drug/metabolite transporter (DMT)-like permease
MQSTLIQKQPSKFLVFAAFAAIYLIWGSTYIAIVIAIEDVPPLLMAGTRFGIAGIILYIFSRLRGEATPELRSIRKISFGGVLMLFLGTGTVAWVEQYISSGLAAIIVATVPLWIVLLDKREWKFNFSNKWIIVGLLVGFAGVLTLFADRKLFDFSGDKMKPISFIVLILGSIAWSAGSLYSKYKPVTGSTGMKASIQMMAAGACSIIAGIVSGEHLQIVWDSISWNSILAILYLIVMGSLVGYIAYVWLLSVKPATMVGTYAYVNPIVALFLGWLLISEHITKQQVIALVIILAGVVLVTMSKGKKQTQ